MIFDGQRFSYGDIDRRANQLAHALIARGVGPETRVGVALPRSEGGSSRCWQCSRLARPMCRWTPVTHANAWRT